MTDLRKLAEAMRGAAPSWQPIETAPKDGTYVLGVRCGHLYVLHFDAREQRWHGGPCPYDDVSHWHPLPRVPGEMLAEWHRGKPAPVAPTPSLAELDRLAAKEPECFCACGRRTSECDRSRKACLSREAE